MTEGKSASPLAQGMGDIGGMLAMQLPPETTPQIQSDAITIPLPDGVKLNATYIHPVGEGPWPVILIRNPYVMVNFLHSMLTGPAFAKHGYAVIVTFVRGAGGSEGDWYPMVHEIEDGRAVADWVAQQEFCDGNIGTFGESYLGMTQWCLADYELPALKTHYIGVMGSSDPYSLFYRRGMFRPELWGCWAGQMMGENRLRMLTPEDNFKILEAAMKTRPASQLGEALIGEHCGWYDPWVSDTTRDDPLWSEGFFAEYSKKASRLVRPVFLEGGWFDIFLRSQIRSWRSMPQDIRDKSRFIISPRSHNGMFPGPDCDKAGLFGVRAALEWFDYMLKGAAYPQTLGVIDAYSIGDGKWTEWKDDFRPARQMEMYFSPGTGEEHALTANTDKTQAKLCYHYDPSDPLETRGGQVITNNRDPQNPMSECSVEQEAVGAREDVLSFVSAPLEEDLPLAGAIQAQLYVSSTAPATAFTVKIMEVGENGAAMNVRDDITDIRWMDEDICSEYTPGEIRCLTISLCDCCWMFRKGSRIRVDIASSNFPAFHLHPNTVQLWSQTTQSQTAEQTVYCGGRTASRIILPIA